MAPGPYSYEVRVSPAGFVIWVLVAMSAVLVAAILIPAALPVAVFAR